MERQEGPEDFSKLLGGELPGKAPGRHGLGLPEGVEGAAGGEAPPSGGESRGPSEARDTVEMCA